MSTSRLIQGVAESTLQRDRSQIGLATTRLLSQFFRARAVTLYQLADDNGITRLMTRVAILGAGAEQVPDVPDDPSTLPPLADFPLCRDCVALDRVVEGITPDGGLLTAFPIHTKAKVSGAIVVESSESLPVPHIDLIHGILRIVENHVALLDYGERDTLTGLLNRKTFELHFENLRKRAFARVTPTPVPEPSWLALVDIDHFKSINDSHGHMFGDEVLLLVSQMMTHNFRGADQIFRFGGEEFLIVLDHASESGAHVALERLRASIEAHTFPQVGRVTVSMGYTRVTSHDIGTLCVERADAALYYAKRNGRNNVKNYEALIASGELQEKTDTMSVELF
jgi:diguanylate cyclase (GGDEF)-like protein